MDDNATTLASGPASAFAALRDLDQRVLDAIPAAVYVCGADGVIVRYNSHAVELWGRAPVPGDTDQRFCGAYRLYHLDGRPLPHAATPMATALATGEAQHDLEVEIEQPDGARCVVRVNIEPLKDSEGRVEGAINCFQDITEQKRADEAVRASHAELEDFFENANVPMHWVDGGGRIVRANRAELALLGYAAEEYVGRDIAEFHADQPTIDDILDRLGRGEKLELYPARLRAKDGSIRHVQISSSAQFRDDRFVRTRCVSIEASSAEERRRLAAIVNSSEDAIISKDLNGVVASWNRSAERLFGYSAEEAVGRPLLELVIPADRREEEGEILACLRRGERVEPYETVRRRKDGSLIDISLTISPVTDDAGRIIGASKIARDISERKHAERQRELLMAELNHRVKNTLAVVQGIAYQTFKHLDTSGPALRAFEGRLGALARAHGRLTQTSWESASLEELVEDTLQVCSADERRVRLEGPRVLLAPRQALAVAMAMHELCTNALKYGALSVESGRIDIAWELLDAGTPGFRLRWQESAGPPVAPPARRGFGSRMIEAALAHDLEGEVVLAFRPEGVCCVIEAPMPEATAA